MNLPAPAELPAGVVNDAVAGAAVVVGASRVAAVL